MAMAQASEFDPARLVLSLPACPKCGGTMWLALIEAVDSDQDKRTFECPQCQHGYSEVVKYR
jgi:uncharacterized protein YbaR (Trm112 family)